MSQMHMQEAASAARIATRVRRSLDLGESVADIAAAQQAIPAWGFVTLSMLCVCAMVLVGALSARGCRVKPIPLALGAERNLSFAMPADTPCTIRVRAGEAILDDLVVDAPPARGTLTPRGRTGVVYRPQPGFKGDDSFAFALYGRPKAVPERAVVRVQIRIN